MLLGRRALLRLTVISVAAFVALAFLYEHDPLAGIDLDVAEWVAAEIPAWAEALARPFSWLGGWIGLTTVGVVAGIWLAREHSWLDLAFLVITFLGTQLAVSLLKDGFDRARPAVGSAVPLPESSSFPSGHAAAGVASLGAVAVLLAQRLSSRPARAWVWGVTVGLGVAVGASRIALNVHFATDVLAGWCFGLAWLASCLLLRDALRTRCRVRSEGSDPVTRVPSARGRDDAEPRRAARGDRDPARLGP